MKTKKNEKTAATSAAAPAGGETVSRLGDQLKSAELESELVAGFVDSLIDTDQRAEAVALAESQDAALARALDADRAEVNRIYRFAFETAKRGEHLRFVSRRWRRVLTAGFLAGLEARAPTMAREAPDVYAADPAPFMAEAYALAVTTLMPVRVYATPDGVSVRTILEPAPDFSDVLETVEPDARD